MRLYGVTKGPLDAANNRKQSGTKIRKQSARFGKQLCPTVRTASSLGIVRGNGWENRVGKMENPILEKNHNNVACASAAVRWIERGAF